MIHVPSHPARSRGVSRRIAIRLLMALATTMTLGAARTISAARGWCRSDPLVRVDGRLAYVIYSAPWTIRQATTGPTEIVFSIPHGVKAELIAPGPGLGEGESVRFVPTSSLHKTKSGVQVRVAARIPADTELPIRLECARRTRAARNNPAIAEGTTNLWVTLLSVF
jgi:hypothetical protein